MKVGFNRPFRSGAAEKLAAEKTGEEPHLREEIPEFIHTIRVNARHAGHRGINQRHTLKPQSEIDGQMLKETHIVAIKILSRREENHGCVPPGIAQMALHARNDIASLTDVDTLRAIFIHPNEEIDGRPSPGTGERLDHRHVASGNHVEVTNGNGPGKNVARTIEGAVHKFSVDNHNSRF